MVLKKKIQIILLLLIVGIFSIVVYFALIKQKVEKIEQQTQEGVSEKIKATELPTVFYGIRTMVLIPAGNFLMGDENKGSSDECPAHSVAIESFYMDETPVSYEDFKKYIDAGGAKSKYWEYKTYNQPENPVTGVDWYQAIDYCNWRSKTEGLTPSYKLTNQLDAWGYPLWELDKSADGYRLPTEAEFEYAARGGLEEKKFPWGDEFNPLLANYDDERGIMKGEWWRLSKVKDTPSNGYGLYGMSGNVWHWTNNWYAQNYYLKSPKNNPIGPETGRTKVLRGGSWGSISSDYLRVAKRSYTAPSNYNYDIGFRCVRPAPREIIDSILNQDITEKKITHEFYKYETAYYNNPLQIDPYSEEFLNRLSQFIADYYPNSIYFQTKIDEQKIINRKQMAELIVEVTKEYNVHPLFLTGIIASESGFGCCSFPRWYNNPMAYHWQNILMKNGLPTYKPNPFRNRKYKDLESGFREFAKGINRDIYIKAAQKDLDNFHLLYVGYRADEWMYTISRIYKDVSGIKLEPHSPVENIGEYIYTDWNKPKTATPDDLNIVDKIINWGHYTPKINRTIDTLIIHSCYDALGNNIYSVDGVLYEFKLYTAGPHYLIGRDGVIYRLVPEQDIGYHAGVSKMLDGRTNVNDFSIGIELLYHENETPNEIQYQQLVKLVKNLKSKYKIDYILGHKDIAPSRKTDPWNFDWQKFNEKLKD